MRFLKFLLAMFLIIPFLGYSQKVEKYNNKGMAKAENHDYEGAIKEYDKALKIDSVNSIILYNRGIAKAKFKDYVGAINDYTKSIKIRPDAKAYFNRGLSYYRSSAYKEAIQDFDSAIELSPNFNSGIYFQRASAKINLTNYQDAELDLTKAIELDPNDAKSYYNRGMTRYVLKKQSESCADLKKAKELGYKFDDRFTNDCP